MAKLGSLFDGIGGFPLVATRYGATPVWAAEIESACVSITRKHFPEMFHLGDITKINGAEIEPVDIITFGSPCQDMSVAGKRAGLAGERSGLFGEAIRIIEEMRGATNNEYPKFAVWENVPGALSSNGGLDFRAVLEAFTAREIPMPESGRWANAGMVRSSSCDVAWRIVDAQYWGVPQRRRRIFLVADFGGERASEILFKPEGLRRNFKACGAQGEGVAGGVGSGAKEANCLLRMRSGCEGGGKGPLISKDRSLTLTGNNDQTLFVGGGNTPIVCVGGVTSNTAINVDLCPALITANGSLPYVAYTLQGNMIGRDDKNGPRGVGVNKDVCFTLNTTDRHCVAICAEQGANVSEDIGYTLDGSNEQAIAEPQKQIIRRLTPTECERLQGFPDGWTSHGHNGKPISDAARYRALGNSIALPCVDYVLGGIAEVL